MKNKQLPRTENPDQDLETTQLDKEGEIISSLNDEVEQPQVVDYSAIHWEERSQALADAQQLIRYASHKGMEVPDDVLESIFSSIGKIETRSCSVGDEVAFWKSFRKLSDMILPVTITSIRASVSRPGFKSKATRETLYFSIFTLLVLILLITGQVYWVIGNNIADEIRADNKMLQELGAGDKKLQELIKETERGGILNLDICQQQKRTETNTPAEVQQMQKQICRRLNANLYFLKGWVSYVRFDKEKKEETINSMTLTPKGEVISSMFQNLVELEYMLTWALAIISAMSTYFLPILYGLVGACAYILRSISKDIANVTFTMASVIQYRLRLPLGMLSGIAVGWFFKSTPESAGFGSIQPLAMSFLAGYGVELFFTAMDKLIGTFVGDGKKE